ncbi:MAG: helix-turn-helix transcriptional regulator [Oscillospiraceae bacterium]|nr:helix-turn-helix transcriptional regulator [Oscillospiraceae bacterium]
MNLHEKLDDIEQYVRRCVDNGTGMPAMRVMSSKWLLRILFHLGRKSPRRFGELRRIIPDLSSAALSSSLRELQELEMISRKQYDEMPVRVEYSITEAGCELLALDYDLVCWERKYFPPAFDS